MAKGFSMDFDFRSPQAQGEDAPVAQTPFRILILGDFSGRGAAADGTLAGRKPVAVDLDNFDQAILRLNIQIPVTLGDGQTLAIPIRKLDDFHPDQLAGQIDLFRNLRQLRRRLADPATFDAAADEARTVLGITPAPAAADSPAAPAIGIEQILDQPSASAAPKSPTEAILAKLVDDLVRPYTLPGVTPQQTQLVTLMDQAIGRQMSAILHAPAFQALESAWRGVDFLLRRIGTEAAVKVYLLDVSKAELAADLASREALDSSALRKLVVEQTIGVAGAEPWSLLVGNYRFDQSPADVRLLVLLSTIAEAAGAPLIAGAHDRLIGCESIAATPDPDHWRGEQDGLWAKLRDMPSAPYLALVLPRFLLRLPYGGSSSPTEAIPFDETAGAFAHEQYLWANGAFAAAAALAIAFRESGWDMQLPGHTELASLPVHMRDVDGEKEPMACAEAYLIERAVDRVHERGLIPLISVKHSDSIRLGAFQSIAEPRTYLAGRWA